MQKKLWIIANFKSNLNLGEVLNWISEVGPNTPRNTNLKVIICPQFTELEEAKKAVLVGNFPLIVGSQDLSPYPMGAYTGEESGQTLHQFINFAIIGHSERRKNFEETDEQVAEKVKQANKNEITPLVCVQGKETPVPQGAKLIAYEPIFAIGTDNPDTPANADNVAKYFKQKYGEDLEVLYGGSISSENCTAFIKQENISGLLIGHKALDAKEFVKIVELSSDI